MTACPHCGRDTSRARFCGHCGGSLRDDAYRDAATGAVVRSPAPGWGQEETGAVPVVDARDTAEGSSWHGPTDDGWADPEWDDPTDTEPIRFSEESPPSSPTHRFLVAAAIGIVLVGVLAASALTFFSPFPGRGARPEAAPTATSTTVPARGDATPQPAALATAREVDGLLERSAQQRRQLRGSLTCRAPAARAARTLEEVYDGRRVLYREANAIDFSTLPEGGELRTNLLAAWRASVLADMNFYLWARERVTSAGPCTTSSNHYATGNIHSQSAERHKQHFADLWEKKVRAPMRLPTRRAASDL